MITMFLMIVAPFLVMKYLVNTRKQLLWVPITTYILINLIVVSLGLLTYGWDSAGAAVMLIQSIGLAFIATTIATIIKFFKLKGK